MFSYQDLFLCRKVEDDEAKDEDPEEYLQDEIQVELEKGCETLSELLLDNRKVMDLHDMKLEDIHLIYVLPILK